MAHKGLIPHNFDLPFNVLRCSHVEYGVTDLAASRRFYADTLGLIVTEETSDAIYLRALEEQNHHSYVLRKSDTPDVTAISFKVAFDEELDALKTHLNRLGLMPAWVDRYAQERTLRTSSPLGIPIEFYARMEKAPTMMRETKTCCTPMWSGGAYLGKHE